LTPDLKAVLALVALLGASCATLERSRESKLVGQWRTTNPRATVDYTFVKDGTFSGRVTSEGTIVANFTGKWSLTADEILYDYISDTVGTIAPGTRDRDKLLTIAADHFVIEARDGSRRKYLRIAQ
jgi:hypothetical protein